MYSNIIISVSDGKASAALPAFSITVSRPTSGSAAISWTAPTQNTDGTALTNLAGFRIVYGTSATALNQTVELSNPSLSTYTITGLASGTWYFAVKAYNTVRRRKLAVEHGEQDDSVEHSTPHPAKARPAGSFQSRREGRMQSLFGRPAIVRARRR